MRYSVKIVTKTGADGDILTDIKVPELYRSLSIGGTLVLIGVDESILCVNIDNIDLMEFTPIG